MTQLEKMEVDRLSRVVESQGWSVSAVDTRGDFIEITIQRPKKITAGG